MARWKLTIEYDGTAFVGWQRQINGLGVQQVVEEAIQKFCGESAQVFVAGRTDAGVHAAGQVAQIALPDGYTAERVREAVNFQIGRAHV